MPRYKTVLRRLFLLILCMATLLPAAPAQAAAEYTTSNNAWRAANSGFAGWTRSGVTLNSVGALRFDAASAVAGSDPYAAGRYNGGNFYNGGAFRVGEALSPVTTSGFPFTQAIASWNAATPAGSWIETQLRARIAGRWTEWYNMGVWTSASGAVKRHSVGGQGDADGSVAVDTLILNKSKSLTADAYQVKLRLFSTGGAVPSVRLAAVALSTTPLAPTSLTPGNPNLWNKRLQVPPCSQMVYTDGGEVWCSPTATSMILGYLSNDNGPCAPRVRAAVAGVYDWIYKGHGNWPLNAAYAATKGYEARVARFSSMAQAESWIAAGVPIAISLAWERGELNGAPLARAGGHLTVLIGFDASGNPIVNDPAAATNGAVTRTYHRAQFESLWLEHSGGTVYLIYPPGRSVPALK